MSIYSVAVNIHDHNSYDGVFHDQIERHTRFKHNLNPDDSHDPEPSREFFRTHFAPQFLQQKDTDTFCFTCSNLGQQFVRDRLEDTVGNTDFLKFRPRRLWNRYQTNNYYYIDHHQSHAAYAFLTSGFADSDILAIDGRGWQFNCVFVDSNSNIIDLSDELSIGGLWNRLAQDIGLGYLGAGKVMGLAGYGRLDETVAEVIDDYLKNPNHKLSDDANQIIQQTAREDVAYTLQHATEKLIEKHVFPLKSSDNICVAGGVAYNGYVNELFTKHYKRVHVPPAVGDEGQALGAYMHADYVLNGNVHVPSVDAGQTHTLNTSVFTEVHCEHKSFADICTETAQAIANGAIVGWFQGKSESGNRALGNRSILADPRNPDIKDTINRTVKKREDFRPFAPAVLEEHYAEYFDTNQPSPYMSRIVPVKSFEIPGVTHVDGTARIQTVDKQHNARFYQIIQEFYRLTGIPMLLNTSFNCQEPIVETPEQAYCTFKKTGLDLLVINDYTIRKNA